MSKMKLNTEEESTIHPKANLLAQEIKFAKLLAGNDTDLATKKKQLNRLKIWLKNRANCSYPFTDNDCLRIWKGLFYSMWMADKPLPQESLAIDISSLVHCFDNVSVSLQFFATFLKTMATEWLGIDQWRINKFLMLVRKVTRETIILLRNNQWDETIIKEFSRKLRETVLAPDTQKGLFMHFTELYLEEVAKVTEGDLSTETLTHLLMPFMKFIATNKEYKLIKCVIRHVFNHLLFQSEAGREYQEKYDAWKEMGFPGESLDDIVFDAVEGGNDEDSAEDGQDDDDVDDDDNDDNNNNESNGQTGSEKVLDPRAGCVNVDMSELDFDAMEIAQILEDMKYQKGTRAKNRKSIDRIVSTYKTFATGKFPIGIQKLNVNRSELELPSIEEKASDLLQFENELLGDQRNLKKMNKRKRKKLISLGDTNNVIKKSPKRPKLKHTANEWQEEDIEPDERVGIENNKKRITNGKPVIIDENDTSVTKTVNNNNISVQIKKKKQGNDIKRKKSENSVENNKKSPAKSDWNEPPKEGEIEYFIPSKKVRLEQANLSLKEESVECKIRPIVAEEKKEKVVNNQLQFNNEDKPATKVKSSSSLIAKKIIVTSTTTKSEIITPLKKQKNSSTPLKEQFNESTPPSASLPKPVIITSEKKVKIMLKMNTSQEATEYINQLKQSPQLPYDSTKRPLKGVLKPNLMPSPINPFYRKMLGL